MWDDLPEWVVAITAFAVIVWAGIAKVFRTDYMAKEIEEIKKSLEELKEFDHNARRASDKFLIQKDIEALVDRKIKNHPCKLVSIQGTIEVLKSDVAGLKTGQSTLVELAGEVAQLNGKLDVLIQFHKENR